MRKEIEKETIFLQVKEIKNMFRIAVGITMLALLLTSNRGSNGDYGSSVSRQQMEQKYSIEN